MLRMVLLLVVALLTAIAFDAVADEGTLLVSFDGDPATSELLRRETARLGGEVRVCSPTTRICILDFAATPPAGAVTALPGVRFVERDQRLVQAPPRPPAAPPSPLDPERFADFFGTAQCPALPELELIRVDEVWEQGIDGSAAPVVAVIDMGFAADHRDLLGRVAGQYDYGDLDDVAEVQPAVAIPHHGTFMAGLIAAVPDNELGRAGVAPFGHLFLQRVVDSWNNQDLSFTIHALTDIIDNHPEVRIVAYSLIPSVISAAYEQAVETLGEAGVLFVAAAGNCRFADCPEADNDVNPLYPMSYPYEHIIVVASTDSEDQLNPWTHFGRESVDLFAPGVDLCSLDITSDTAVEVGSGTSYAAPIVAAAAALVLEAHPNLRNVDLARLLRATVQPLPELAHLVRSGGRLDVAAAVAAAVPWIGWPPNLVVDGELDFTLAPVSNYGAAGEATVLIFHGPEVEIALTDDRFEAESFDAGELIALPEGGVVEASTAGMFIRGSLGEHRDEALPLHLRGVQLGSSPATVRLTLRSAEGTLLSAPYLNEGSVTDQSGVEAHPFTIEVTALAGDEPPTDGGPTDGGPTDGGPTDGGPTADGDLPADLVGHDPDSPGSGGCTVVPGGPRGWWPGLRRLVGGLAL